MSSGATQTRGLTKPLARPGPQGHLEGGHADLPWHGPTLSHMPRPTLRETR